MEGVVEFMPRVTDSDDVNDLKKVLLGVFTQEASRSVDFISPNDIKSILRLCSGVKKEYVIS